MAAGEVTKDWLKACKFYSNDVDYHTRYVSPEYRLVSFKVIEIDKREGCNYEDN